MLETLLDEIAERGWLLSNLFQLDNGTWQANLRTPTHHTDWGRGPTPSIALSLAIDAIESAEPTCAHETVVTTGTPNLFALLANLRKPAQTCFRGKL